MDEPSRIGLTATTGAQLDELLEDLNPETGIEGIKLIKFDLYRLAVALGLKNSEPPAPLADKSVTNLRVVELDPNGVLATAVENSALVPEGVLIYEFIERLAERGIKAFYQAYQQTGQLPLEEYFEE
jgi:hypothetical protein